MNVLEPVKSPVPVIRQVYNSCGIAAILMALKPNKNKVLDAFLRNLEKRVTRKMKISSRKYGFLDRVQFALCWLLLKAIYGDDWILQMLSPVIPDLELVRSLIDSKLDEMLVYQGSRGNKKIGKDIETLQAGGKITPSLLEAYIDEQKTDAELKLLGAMFGLRFAFVPRDEGGGALGVLEALDPRDPASYMLKVQTLARYLASGAVLGNYEYHWLTLREISPRGEKFLTMEANKDSVEEMESAPHDFLFNNPLSGTVLRLSRISIIEKYHMYCFDLDLEFQEKMVGAFERQLTV